LPAKPAEYKTVQAPILAYAQEIGWTYVPRVESEKRRGFDHSKATPAEQAAEASPYFDDLLDSQERKLNERAQQRRPRCETAKSEKRTSRPQSAVAHCSAEISTMSPFPLLPFPLLFRFPTARLIGRSVATT
jgi:hypothetical protein